MRRGGCPFGTWLVGSSSASKMYRRVMMALSRSSPGRAWAEPWSSVPCCLYLTYTVESYPWKSAPVWIPIPERLRTQPHKAGVRSSQFKHVSCSHHHHHHHPRDSDLRDRAVLPSWSQVDLAVRRATENSVRPKSAIPPAVLHLTLTPPQLHVFVRR